MTKIEEARSRNEFGTKGFSLVTHTTTTQHNDHCLT